MTQDSDKTVFWGPSGKIGEIPGFFRQAEVSSGRAYILQEETLLTCGSQGSQAALCPVLPGESLLACPGMDGALLIRPARSLSFGEPWAVRAISLDGQSLWETSLPGIPVMADATRQALAIALRDVAAGGRLSVAMADASSGKVLWTCPLGSGHWRNVAITRSDNIAYSTSREAGLLDSLGAEIWTYSPKEELHALSVGAGRLIVSVGSRGHWGIEAFSEDGTPAWGKSTPTKAHALQTNGTRVVALCQNHVIGFSLEDGEREITLPTRDIPLAMGEDVLLLGQGSGAYLMKIEMVEARTK